MLYYNQEMRKQTSEGEKEMRRLRKVELAPYQQKQMEQVYLREIRKCNEAIRNATKESTKEYIRTVKRKPLIENLRNVRNGYVFE